MIISLKSEVTCKTGDRVIFDFYNIVQYGILKI